MEITDKFFDKVLILKTRSRVDDRGRMTVAYEDDFEKAFSPFVSTE